MVNRRRYLYLIISFAFIFFINSLITQTAVNAQECRIIKLHGTALPLEQNIDIEPQILEVPKGGCVIWSNWVRADEVKVIFKEGKKCEEVTVAPTGFALNENNCYVNIFLSMGETASLRFVEEGTFDYVVRIGQGIEEEIGKIIVK